MKFFHSKGFLLGSPIKGQSLPNQYDGYKLDELILSTTMTSRADVENVIAYLQIHRFCFDKDCEQKPFVSKEMFQD